MEAKSAELDNCESDALMDFLFLTGVAILIAAACYYSTVRSL